MLSSVKVFYRNVYSHLNTTGSIAPSSRFLANAMVEGITRKSEPLRILEAGPGTGPFTKKIARMMEDGDRLDLCELNDGFVQHLRGLIETDPAMKHHRERIGIFHKPVQELEGERCYDYIVSGLPFNNFDPALVQGILENYKRLLKPEGRLTFFEYAWVRNMKKPFVWGAERERVDRVGQILGEFLSHYEVETRFVALNFPPSVVHVCRFG